MNRASVFCIRTGSFAGTGDTAIFMTDFRTFEFHPEKSVQESMWIMFGSTGKKRKHRKITLWIHKHIQVIAMVPAVIGRIPSDVAVRPWKIAVAITVGNAFFFTVTDAFFPFSVWSNNGIQSPAIARECGCIRSFEKEKLRKRLLRKRVFSKMQLRGFCTLKYIPKRKNTNLL